MILSPEQRARLLEGKEVEVRVLKKEMEFECSDAFFDSTIKNKKILAKAFKEFLTPTITSVLAKNGKPKFQVGRDYAVQEKGKALRYCPKCKHILTEEQIEIFKKFAPLAKAFTASFTNFMADNGLPCPICKNIRTITEPLRFQITGIRNEHLLDVTEEGFENKWDFLRVFCQKNKRMFRKGLHETAKMKDTEPHWNPEVWVLSGKIKGDKK